MVQRHYYSFSNLFIVICVFAFSVFVKSTPANDNEIRENAGNVYEGLLTQSAPKSVTSFTIGLFQRLGRELRSEENILLSPMNVYAALLMIHLGAGERTRESLNEVLKLSGTNRDFSKVHETFSEIFKKLERRSSNPDEAEWETILANGFFMQKNHPILDSYMQSLRKYYSANATNLDFKTHAQEATDAINAFISEGTRKRINEFYRTPLPVNTVAVLVSAMYFKARWENPFNRDETILEKFNTGTGEIEVPMMRNKGRLLYSFSDILQFDSIELLYRGDEFAMIVQLPRPGQTMKNLTEHLHLIDIHELTRNAKIVGVDYKIPKMKLSWKRSLVGPLQLEDVFRTADLSLMTRDEVPISDMQQATEMEIDEQGTITTAATAASLSRKFTPPLPADELVKFYVDRPFLASIIHRPTQMILFNGLIQKPTH